MFWLCDNVGLKPVWLYTLVILHMTSSHVFSCGGRSTKAMIRLRWCIGWYVPLLFAYTNIKFSHVEAQILFTLRLKHMLLTLYQLNKRYYESYWNICVVCLLNTRERLNTWNTQDMKYIPMSWKCCLYQYIRRNSQSDQLLVSVA